jgi:hypothetical protein
MKLFLPPIVAAYSVAFRTPTRSVKFAHLATRYSSLLREEEDEGIISPTLTCGIPNTLARNIFLDATKKGASPNLADQLAGDWGIAMEKQLEKDIAIDRDGTLANTEDGTIALGTVADFEKDGSPLIVQEKIAYEIAGNGSVTSNPLSATGTWAPTIIPATWGRGRLSESSLPARKCARRNGNEILKWEAD